MFKATTPLSLDDDNKILWITPRRGRGVRWDAPR
jgi:hypothetical protein